MSLIRADNVGAVRKLCVLSIDKHVYGRGHELDMLNNEIEMALFIFVCLIFFCFIRTLACFLNRTIATKTNNNNKYDK